MPHSPDHADILMLAENKERKKERKNEWMKERKKSSYSIYTEIN